MSFKSKLVLAIMSIVIIGTMLGGFKTMLNGKVDRVEAFAITQGVRWSLSLHPLAVVPVQSYAEEVLDIARYGENSPNRIIDLAIEHTLAELPPEARDTFLNIAESGREWVLGTIAGSVGLSTERQLKVLIDVHRAILAAAQSRLITETMEDAR